jgi:hypothetical protein
MRLEQQVCSVELAMKLKELGVKQNSHFWWSRAWIASFGNSSDWKLCRFGETFNDTTRCSAFTSAELGEMLPHDNASQRKDTRRNNAGGLLKQWTAYYLLEDGSKMVFERGNTEADARAKLLIHLIQNKLVSLP